MANSGADYYTDPAYDPLVPGQELMQPQPIPGIVHGAITGINGVVSPGLWDGADVSGVGFVPGLAGTKKVLGGAAKRIGGALENLTTDPYLAPDESKNQPPAPEVSPAVDDQARTRNALPDILAGGQPPTGSLADKLVKTTKEGSIGGKILNGPYDEARSGSTPGATADPTLGGGAAQPPTQDQPNEGFRPGTGQGLPGMLGKFFQNAGNFFDANRYTLMALGGGLAGSQSWGQGIGRGLQAASRVQPLDVQQNATVGYLTRSGMDPQMARAVASNPQLTQAALGQMTGLEPPKTQTLQGPMGASLMQWNPQTRKWENALGGGTGASGNLPSGWEQMTPEQRLASLDPVTRGMVETLHQGGAPPPGRMAYVMGLAQQIWPGYTENDYNAAKTMAQDLQKSSPSSMGGLLSNGMSAFGHLAELGDAMVGVGAFNGPNIPGGGIVGQVGNYGRNVLASPDLKGAQSQEADTALKYGEEGTKFYAATGGGEAERTAALNNATGPGKLSTEKAGYLRSELGLMQRRMQDQLSKLESNPSGQQWLANPANRVRVQQMGQDIAHLKHTIAQLDPNGPEAAAEKAQGAPQAQAGPQQQQVPPPQQRQIGQTYNTPKGPMRWMADGWHPVQ